MAYTNYTFDGKENKELREQGGSLLRIPAPFRRKEQVANAFDQGFLGAGRNFIESNYIKATQGQDGLDEYKRKKEQAYTDRNILRQEAERQWKNPLVGISLDILASVGPEDLIMFGAASGVLKGVKALNKIKPLIGTAKVRGAQSLAMKGLRATSSKQLTKQFGKVGGRMAKGAVEGAVGNALAEPFIHMNAEEYNFDHELQDSLVNVFFGATIGSGLHVGGGAIGDAISKHRTSKLAHQMGMLKAMDDIASGRKTAVDQIYKADQYNSSTLKRERALRKLESINSKIDEEVFLSDFLSEDQLAGLSSKEAITLKEELSNRRIFTQNIDNLHHSVQKSIRAQRVHTIRKILGRNLSTESSVDNITNLRTSSMRESLQSLEGKLEASQEKVASLKQSDFANESSFRRQRNRVNKKSKELRKQVLDMQDQIKALEKDTKLEFTQTDSILKLNRDQFFKKFLDLKEEMKSNPNLKSYPDVDQASLKAGDLDTLAAYEEYFNTIDLDPTEMGELSSGNLDYLNELYDEVQLKKEFSGDREQIVQELLRTLEDPDLEVKLGEEQAFALREAEIEARRTAHPDNIEADIEKANENLEAFGEEADEIIEQERATREDIEDVITAREEALRCVI